LPAAGIHGEELSPIEIRKKAGDGLAFCFVALQAEEAGDGLVEIKDPGGFVDHEDTIFYRIEECLEEVAFASEALDDGLETVRVEAAYAAENFIEEAGFRRGHGGIAARTTFYV
jgi:hypothetical protein